MSTPSLITAWIMHPTLERSLELTTRSWAIVIDATVHPLADSPFERATFLMMFLLRALHGSLLRIEFDEKSFGNRMGRIGKLGLAPIKGDSKESAASAAGQTRMNELIR